MTKDEALRMALEALANAYWPTESDLMPAHNIKECADAITAIREALAESEQEPVAWWNDTGTHIDLNVSGRGTPLYTTPPQRKPQEFVCSTGLCHYRKPLTNDRAHQILLDMAKHIETFGDENITEQALSAECIRFILERVTAYGIKEEV